MIIEIAIGYNDDLFKMGKFIAQSIDASSSLISMKAISQDLSKGRIKHNRVFKNKSLDNVPKTLAKDLDLTLQTGNNLKTKQLSYYLQKNKTSLEVSAELSEIFYAIANIKDNYLVFISKDTANFKIPQSAKLGANEQREVENTKEIDINIDYILSITKQDVGSKYYNGVIYNYWNIKEAKLESTKLGSEPYLLLQRAVDESLKNSYINCKYKEIKEKGCIKLSLQGNPEYQAGFSFALNNTEKYRQFNGQYRIEKVTYR